MAAKDQQILNHLKIFGLALTIPSVLVGGPLLGYGIARVLISKGASPSILAYLVGAGSILALVQTFGTVKLLFTLTNKSDKSEAAEKNNDTTLRDH